MGNSCLAKRSSRESGLWSHDYVSSGIDKLGVDWSILKDAKRLAAGLAHVIFWQQSVFSHEFGRGKAMSAKIGFALPGRPGRPRLAYRAKNRGGLWIGVGVPRPSQAPWLWGPGPPFWRHRTYNSHAADSSFTLWLRIAVLSATGGRAMATSENPDADGMPASEELKSISSYGRTLTGT